MRRILLFLAVLSGVAMHSQEIIRNTKSNDLKLSSLPYYSYGKGLGITTPDSLFQLNLRFRIQNRLTYYDNDGQNNYYEGQVRRLRLRFDGFVENPKILYVLQLSFGAGDVGPERNGENLNVIRDAMVYYKPGPHWQWGFGVTKLPGARQTVNSSGALQLTDRNINHFKFAIDRDFGLHFANLNEFNNRFSYNFKGAITLGEGRNWTTNTSNSNLKDNNGLSYTGKIELLPLGTFKKEGHYFEGDILREEHPKFMVSGAYNFNDRARKTLGQTGDLLYEAKDISTFFGDLLAKYNGWAFTADYMARQAKNPVTKNPADVTLKRPVFTGWGTDCQLSYVLRSNYEFVGRYSLQQVNNDIAQYAPNVKQYTFGVNKYIWEHALKLQSEVTYENQKLFSGDNRNNWYFRVQIEIGI